MTPTLTGVAEYVEHFRARVLQDALNEATAAYWLRRAEAFENARVRPRERPSEPLGAVALSGDDKARDERLATTAQACRNKAAVLRMYPAEVEPIVWAALAETHAAPTTETATETTNSSTSDRSAA